MEDAPSPSQRARTILAGSASVSIGVEVVGATGPQDWSTQCLVLSTEPLPAGRTALPVALEVADAAPLPVRNRIRGRVRLSGRTTTEPGCEALHLRASTVTLVEDESALDVDVDELLAAEPDPLHAVEASMLDHLDSAHGEVIATLTRLIDVRHRLGVVRVWPYRLDRHGLVLRVEYATGHTDHRLPFRAPLDSPQQLTHELTALIARATHRTPPCTRTQAGGGGLVPILRAAAVAERLCSPQHDDPQP